MKTDGFTLVETLIAMAIIGVVLVAMLPAFITYFDSNTRNELRTGGIEAAQFVVESLRRDDPSTLPSSGSSAIQVVTVGERDYETITHYCVQTSYCATNARHLIIEVRHGGQEIYSIETVYTALQ